MRKLLFYWGLGGAFAAAVWPGAGAAALERELQIGAYYGEGDYGTNEKTTFLALPLTVKFRALPWTVKVSGSLVEIAGPGNVNTGTVTTSTRQRRERGRGLGDTYFSVTYHVPARSPTRRFFWDLTARVKFPTADEDRGLGTGETDADLQAELLTWLGEDKATTGFVRAGYRFRGQPAGVSLKDSPHAGFGAVRRVAGHRIGVMLTWIGRITGNDTAQREVMVFSTLPMSRGRRLTVYGLGGLSESSPDVALGLQYHFSF